MPELPEVEIIRRQLAKAILNKRIAKVEILSRKQFPQSPKLVLNEKIIGVERRAKILIFRLSHGKNLVAHLKLTGQFIWISNPPANGKVKLKKTIQTIGEYLPSKSTRVIFTLSKGEAPGGILPKSARWRTKEGKLFFNEMRKFGWIKLLNDEQLGKELKKYGIEPFRTDFTLARFEKNLKTTKRTVKQVLLDQEKIAGIGNIYANESLYLAGINPSTPSNQLQTEQIKSLKKNLLKVLRLGLKYGGASDEYYLHPDTTKGTYQNHFLIYGKAGKLCKKCGSTIKRISLGGRGTYFCPSCQRPTNN